MQLTNGSGGPPPDWDPTEATERIRARAHAFPEHQAWLKQVGNHCTYCEGDLDHE